MKVLFFGLSIWYLFLIKSESIPKFNTWMPITTQLFLVIRMYLLIRQKPLANSRSYFLFLLLLLLTTQLLFPFLCHLHLPRSIFKVPFLFCSGSNWFNLAQLGSAWPSLAQLGLTCPNLPKLAQNCTNLPKLAKLTQTQFGFGDFPRPMHWSLLRVCLRVPWIAFYFEWSL